MTLTRLASSGFLGKTKVWEGAQSRGLIKPALGHCYLRILLIILLHEKFLRFDWLRAVVFQLNLKYLHVKITNLLWVVV